MFFSVWVRIPYTENGFGICALPPRSITVQGFLSSSSYKPFHCLYYSRYHKYLRFFYSFLTFIHTTVQNSLPTLLIPSVSPSISSFVTFSRSIQALKARPIFSSLSQSILLFLSLLFFPLTEPRMNINVPEIDRFVAGGIDNGCRPRSTGHSDDTHDIISFSLLRSVLLLLLLFIKEVKPDYLAYQPR